MRNLLNFDRKWSVETPDQLLKCNRWLGRSTIYPRVKLFYSNCAELSASNVSSGPVGGIASRIDPPPPRCLTIVLMQSLLMQSDSCRRDVTRLGVKPARSTSPNLSPVNTFKRAGGCLFAEHVFFSKWNLAWIFYRVKLRLENKSELFTFYGHPILYAYNLNDTCYVEECS